MKIHKMPKYWRSFFGGEKIKNNIATETSLINSRRAIFLLVSSTCLLFGGGYIGLSSADPLPVVDVSGTLSADTTWSSGNVYVVQSQVIVPDGITLTINSGAIVKYETGYGYNTIEVSSGGTLNVDGTSDNPVTFTSYKDDSVGGDSNGDGSSSSPAENDYDVAIEPAGGTINASYANFEYAGTAISGSGAGTITVSDSTFANDYNGVYASVDPLSFERNQFSTTSTAIYADAETDLTGIVLSGSNENTFTGSTTAAVTVETQDSTVPADTTWEINSTSGAVLKNANGLTIDGTMEVDTGVVFIMTDSLTYQPSVTVDGTLNLASGSIVKLVQGNGIAVALGGTLNVDGTSDNPVTFTSYKDDSVGGDSNGDGSSSSPAENDYSEGIEPEGGDVNVGYTNFEYASEAIGSAGGTGSVTISDSTFTNDYNGVYVSDQSLSLERNQFATTSTAVYAQSDADLTEIILSGPNENTFSGSTTTATTVQVADSAVPADTTWEINSTSGAVLKNSDSLTLNGTVNIDAGVLFIMTDGYSWIPSVIVNGTLNFADGSIAKFVQGVGIEVTSTGTLDATGTSDNPVTFTSYKDDSVGGDSNGDGSSSSPAENDYDVAIEPAGGVVSLSHTNLKYASTAISSGGGTGPIVMSDGSFTYDDEGIYTGGESLSLERNQFATTSTAIHVDNDTDLSGVVLSGSNENTFSGSTTAAVTVETQDSTVPADTTWEINSTSGAVLKNINGLAIDGMMDVDAHVIYVMTDNYTYQPSVIVNGTLNFADGSVVKLIQGTGIEVSSGGTLNVDGTSDNPVTFTSYKDDSVGGDSNGDGSSSSPAENDYDVAIEPAGGTINASYANFEYAGTAIEDAGSESTLAIDNASFVNDSEAAYLDTSQANFESTTISNVSNGLNVSGSSNVVFRGSFSDISDKAITACNWNGNTSSGCSVDAAYTDWGSSDGPLVSGDDLVCGMVTVSPWLYDGTTYTNSNIFDVNNCDNSTTPDAQLNTAASNFSEALNIENASCDLDVEAACTAADVATTCIDSYVAAASLISPFTFPLDDPAGDATTFATDTNSAANDYIHGEESESVSGDGSDFANKLHDTVNTLLDMANAYNTCEP